MVELGAVETRGVLGVSGFDSCLVIVRNNLAARRTRIPYTNVRPTYQMLDRYEILKSCVVIVMNVNTIQLILQDNTHLMQRVEIVSCLMPLHICGIL